MAQSTQASAGISFFGLLTLIFVVAKITGYIDWSWWLVFAPMIFSTIVWLSLFVVFVLAVLAGSDVGEQQKIRRLRG